MNWYYMKDGQQAGPVDEAEFQRLVASGAILPATKVWKEGMADWVSYSEVGAPAVNAHQETVTCAVSGKAVPKDQAVQISGHWISAERKEEYLQKLREGVAIDTGLNYAGFWIRFGAKLVDGLILLIPNMAIQFGIPLLMGAGEVDPKDPFQHWPSMLVVFLLQIIIGVSYSVWFVGSRGATPGKMACGLKIVRPDGSPVGYGLAFGRMFAEILSGLTIYIGYLMAAFDSEKRALHDRICSTRVIKVKKA